MIISLSDKVERKIKYFESFRDKLIEIHNRSLERLNQFEFGSEKYYRKLEKLEARLERKFDRLEDKWEKFLSRVEDKIQKNLDKLSEKVAFSNSSSNSESDQSDVGDRLNALLDESKTYYDQLEEAEGPERDKLDQWRDPNVEEVVGHLKSMPRLDLTFDVEFEFAARNVTVFGSALDEELVGSDGNDAICGGDGDDVIKGGAGRDIIEGGEGDDILMGGAGIDVFVFRKGCDKAVLADFELGYDILDLEDFGGMTYEELVSHGKQVGRDVHFQVDYDLLVLQNANLASMVPDDLCIR